MTLDVAGDRKALAAALIEAILAEPAPQEPAQQQQLLISVKTAAERLDTSATTIRRLIKAQRLPSVRLGDRVMIRPEDLEAFVGGLT